MVHKDSLRIALVAPLYESIPPALYGGTERVVAGLSEELVQLGHEVTIYASGDSRTAARVVPICPRSLRLAESVDPVVHHIVQNEWVFRDAGRYDIIHFHNGYLHFSLTRKCATPTVTTLHGRLDLDDLRSLANEFSDVPVVSISNAQRVPLPSMKWIDTVYNGIQTDVLKFNEAAPGGYFVFLGRISPEKRADRAIEIARRVKRRLIIAAKVDPADQHYFDNEIKPLLSDPLIEFIGEVNETQKGDLLGRAAALLFPIDWPEPFGLVMVEAMACGTPVIAFSQGSVPEVMQDGVSGFVVDDIDQAVSAAEKIGKIDRGQCRAYFEGRFTARHMAEAYVRVYRNLIETSPGSGERLAPQLISTL